MCLCMKEREKSSIKRHRKNNNKVVNGRIEWNAITLKLGGK